MEANTKIPYQAKHQNRLFAELLILFKQKDLIQKMRKTKWGYMAENFKFYVKSQILTITDVYNRSFGTYSERWATEYNYNVILEQDIKTQQVTLSLKKISEYEGAYARGRFL